MVTIKKYSNRRLYDTSESQYVTLEELAAKIRSGVDVKVVDAKTDEDLTQAILTQIIMESRGASRLLPSRMLMQLIRMEDDALAEFFGQYMSYALEFYQRVKLGTRSMGAFGQGQAPGAGMFGAPNPFAQWMGQMYNGGWPGAFGGQAFGGQAFGGEPPMPQQMPPQPAPPEPAPPEPAPAPEDAPKAATGEVAAMRQELEELKELIKAAALGKTGGE